MVWPQRRRWSGGWSAWRLPGMSGAAGAFSSACGASGGRLGSWRPARLRGVGLAMADASFVPCGSAGQKLCVWLELVWIKHARVYSYASLLLPSPKIALPDKGGVWRDSTLDKARAICRFYFCPLVSKTPPRSHPAQPICTILEQVQRWPTTSEPLRGCVILSHLNYPKALCFLDLDLPVTAHTRVTELRLLPWCAGSWSGGHSGSLESRP